MNNMIENLTKKIDSMSSIPKKVIKYGFFTYLLIIFSCLAVSIINKHYLGNLNEITKISMQAFKSSFSVLAIVIIGGLLMDYISRSK